MKITGSAISLNVADERASADFLKTHFAFDEAMAADGFVSLRRSDAGFNVVFLRLGLSTFKPMQLRGHRVDGLLLVFVVDDIDTEYARLAEQDLSFVTPIETEPWGERYFQVADPNGGQCAGPPRWSLMFIADQNTRATANDIATTPTKM